MSSVYVFGVISKMLQKFSTFKVNSEKTEDLEPELGSF
jgi:hypothetical protein